MRCTPCITICRMLPTWPSDCTTSTTGVIFHFMQGRPQRQHWTDAKPDGLPRRDLVNWMERYVNTTIGIWTSLELVLAGRHPLVGETWCSFLSLAWVKSAPPPADRAFVSSPLQTSVLIVLFSARHDGQPSRRPPLGQPLVLGRPRRRPRGEPREEHAEPVLAEEEAVLPVTDEDGAAGFDVLDGVELGCAGYVYGEFVCLSRCRGWY